MIRLSLAEKDRDVSSRNEAMVPPPVDYLFYIE